MNIKDFATGIDVESVDRFEKYSFDKNCSFIKRVFTEKEIEYCYSDTKTKEHLAVRFAAKEAVFKALSSLELHVNYIDVEILNDEKGVPFVKILNNDYRDLIFRLSLSHGNGSAVASVFVMKIL